MQSDIYVHFLPAEGTAAAIQIEDPESGVGLIIFIVKLVHRLHTSRRLGRHI